MAKRKEEKKVPGESSRRSFLTKIWIGLGIIALAEFVVVGISFLRPHKSKAGKEKSDSMIAAGSVDKFALKSVTAFVRGRFYLSRLEGGGFLALSHKCTHLGCTVPWIDSEERFVCPCHASSFDISGDVLSPPAPRPLDTFPVRIENNLVKVDTSKPTKRQNSTAAQVVRS